VSCSSATFCLTFGLTLDQSSVVVDRWDGRVWSIGAIPEARAGFGLEPEGISCVTPHLCFVVGNYFGGGVGIAPLIAEWNGARWTTLDREFAGINGDFASVSCSSPTSCFAVGTADHGPESATHADRTMDGATWTRVASTSPSTMNYLSSVSCASASSCFAIGDQFNALTGGYTTLTERWSGADWTVIASPDLPGVSTALRDISCASATNCIGVGDASTDQVTNLLTERWNGVQWSIVATPRPSGARTGRFIHMSDVSCAKDLSCVAVGWFDSGTSSGPFAERWNGTRWPVVPVPTVGDASVLVAISCLAGSNCFSVGSYSTFDGYFPLTERYS
jgi:hypothetical protein